MWFGWTEYFIIQIILADTSEILFSISKYLLWYEQKRTYNDTNRETIHHLHLNLIMIDIKDYKFECLIKMDGKTGNS